MLKFTIYKKNPASLGGTRLLREWIKTDNKRAPWNKRTWWMCVWGLIRWCRDKYLSLGQKTKGNSKIPSEIHFKICRPTNKMLIKYPKDNENWQKLVAISCGGGNKSFRQGTKGNKRTPIVTEHISRFETIRPSNKLFIKYLKDKGYWEA